MNIKDCEEMTLQLINRYSVAGAVIPLSYNNQSDVVVKITHLLNDAQFYIATTAKKIPAQAKFDPSIGSPTSFGEYYIYPMPADFFEVRGSGMPYSEDASIDMTWKYKWIGVNQLCIDKSLNGAFYLDYSKYPTKITSATDTNTELSNTAEAQTCVPYYIAAHLVQHENGNLYANLMNEFETKLSRIIAKPEIEVSEIEDVYGFQGGVTFD